MDVETNLTWGRWVGIVFLGGRMKPIVRGRRVENVCLKFLFDLHLFLLYGEAQLGLLTKGLLLDFDGVFGIHLKAREKKKVLIEDHESRRRNESKNVVQQS